MTVSLPRLNSLTGMVEPATGDPTVRMQSFWNQAMYAIETLQATPGGVSSFNTRVGAVTLAGIDVTTALGYIPTSPASLAAALTPYALQSAVVTSLGGAVGAITLGSGLTMTGQVLAATGGGGGSSPYTVPLLANFTVLNAPAGSTATDSSTGLAFASPAIGSIVLQAYQDNAAVGTTFTVTIGFNFTYLSGDAQVGIFVGDATGKLFVWEISPSDGALGQQYFTSATNYNSNPTNYGTNTARNFLQIKYDGTNFLLSMGNDLNSLVLVGTASSTSWISTPTAVGISALPYTGVVHVTFFHYLHTL